MTKDKIMKALTYDDLKAIINKNQLQFFTGDKSINLVGIRTSNKITNKFEDILLLAYVKDGKKSLLKYDKFTTRPGFKYMVTTLLNPKGCAVVIPGQHSGIWKFGKHKGKYPALVQIGNTITVGRDGNRNYDIDYTKTTTGFFGINMHHANGNPTVGGYSAGCQVFQYPSDLDEVLFHCHHQRTDSFSYTLLTLDQL